MALTTRTIVVSTAHKMRTRGRPKRPISTENNKVSVMSGDAGVSAYSNTKI